MKVSRFALAAALLAGSATLAARTGAQGAPPPKPATAIPPVEVVATRLPEAPHDVPAAIEVISGADLRARGALSLRDALALATGISISPGGDQGPAGAVPEFWGLREFDAFLLVVDGIPFGGAFNPAIASLSLRDVERVEILRGPAPVTYGATSFVGVIHVVHKAAAEDTKYLAASGGNFGSGGASADLSVPLAGDWKSRLSADYDKQGFADARTSYSRAHALWRAADVRADRKTWLTADVNILRQDPASPHPRDGKTLSTAVPLDANHNPAGAYLNDDRFSLSAGFERPGLGGATWGTSASYTYTSSRTLRGFLTDLSNSPNNASGFREKIAISDGYLDTHLIWPANGGMRWMAGADALWANGNADGATFTYTAPLSGATTSLLALPPSDPLGVLDQRLFLGAYGSTEWRPDARVTLSAGVRLNHTLEKRDADATVTNTRLSGSLGAMFTAWERGPDHVKLYADARDTFKPAAVDFGLGDDGAGVLQPETSRSYEGGAKARLLEGRLDVEASVFHMDFENLVTSTIVNGQPALQNTGHTRFTGFEFGADLRLASAVFVRASYSAHDAAFVDFVQAFDGVPTQLAGKKVEMSARSLASAGVSYAPDEGFIASASVNYTGDRFMNMRNTAPLSGFSTFDAGVGYRTTRWELRIDGKNLGDARDVVSESEFGDAQYYRMPARTVRAGIAWRY